MAAFSQVQRTGQDAAASPAARLRTAVIMENDLDRLSCLFAGLLAEHRVPGHYCVRHAEAGMLPLFGDRPALAAAADAVGIGCGHAAGGACTMLLDPGVEALDEKSLATVRGYAGLVAARGALLVMKQATVPTACPLSLEQRTILARLLCGTAEIDIAAELGLPVVLVSALADDACRTLGKQDRAETIAAAARQGWLVMSVNPFYTLSLRNQA